MLLCSLHTNTAIRCPQLENPENGEVTLSGDTPFSTATYVCDSGYELKGVQIRICEIDGTWSDQAPFCIGIIHCIYIHLR